MDLIGLSSFTAQKTENEPGFSPTCWATMSTSSTPLMVPWAIGSTPCVPQSTAPAASAWLIAAVPWNCDHSIL